VPAYTAVVVIDQLESCNWIFRLRANRCLGGKETPQELIGTYTIITIFNIILKSDDRLNGSPPFYFILFYNNDLQWFRTEDVKILFYLLCTYFYFIENNRK